jgi:hypothetical protein
VLSVTMGAALACAWWCDSARIEERSKVSACRDSV